MANSAKAKGDSAEREAAQLLSDLTGYPVRRKLGAGRTDDEGDLEGVPDTVLQVANWADPARACREKPLGAELQRRNAGATHAATLVRFRGVRSEALRWRVVLTLEQYATLLREAIP